jgi:hypothetical protein
MDNNEIAMPKFTIAEGPQGLMEVLSHFQQQAEQDADFRATQHYIMYCLKDQKSLIKVDVSERPFQFWYCDLLGRPATNVVKDTIAEFLWEKCGEKDRYFKESGRESS